MVRLNEKKEKTSLVMRDLKDGQIAIITDSRYTGTVIQIYKGNAVAIGQESGSGWTDMSCNTLEVRILEVGETLTIMNN